jgi:hypothetical protein
MKFSPCNCKCCRERADQDRIIELESKNMMRLNKVKDPQVEFLQRKMNRHERRYLITLLKSNPNISLEDMGKYLFNFRHNPNVLNK